MQQIMKSICKYLSPAQFAIIQDLLLCEERQFFIDRMTQLASDIETAPKTRGQTGLGDDAVAHFHYFYADCHWYITELDIDGGVDQAFGFACLFGDWEMAEYGYVSITEITQVGAEIDLYWTNTTIRDIKIKNGIQPFEADDIEVAG